MRASRLRDELRAAPLGSRQRRFLRRVYLRAIGVRKVSPEQLRLLDLEDAVGRLIAAIDSEPVARIYIGTRTGEAIKTLRGLL